MKTRIVWGLCGSFCTLEKILECMRCMNQEKMEILPVLSMHTAMLDTRFGTAESLHKKLKEITGHCPITTLQGAEPIGPKHLADVMMIAPCTGNTLAKLAAGITDSPVLMAAKSHLRNGRPVVIAISTNDGLSASAQNIGRLLNTKHIYFVPFTQDDFLKKPVSLQSDFSLLSNTIQAALEEKQIQPILQAPR